MEQLLRHYRARDLCLQGKIAHLQHKNHFWRFKKELYEKEWVVYAKEAFGSPASVVEYLGRYTHKIAISNQRILTVDEKTVTFSYLDRKVNCKKKSTMPGEKFIARFLLHVLPKGYTRIRHYGFFGHKGKGKGAAICKEKARGAQCTKAKIYHKGRTDDHKRDRSAGLQRMWQPAAHNSGNTKAKGFATTKTCLLMTKFKNNKTSRSGNAGQLCPGAGKKMKR